MALSKLQTIHRKSGSRSRSRSPIQRDNQFSKTPGFTESFEITHRASHTARKLLDLVRNHFKTASRSKSGSGNEEGTGLKVMDFGPTIVEHFSPFALPPLFYDGIRPARAGRGTETRHQKDFKQSSSKARVIPIQIEHISSEKSSATCDRIEKDTTASPFVVDDVNRVKPTSRQNLNRSKSTLASVRCNSPILIDFCSEDAKTEKDLDLKHQSLEGRLSKKGGDKEDIVYLSKTPKVENNILPPRGQKDISYTKGKWTVIPVHHVKKEPAKSPVSSNVGCDKVIHVDSIKRNDETDVLEIIPSHTQSERFQPNTKKLYPTLDDVDSNKRNRDLMHSSFHHTPSSLVLQQLFDSCMSPEKDLLTEQDVNPTPSYPIYAELKTQLAKENRKIDYIRGDGNCFFRALSKHLYGTEKYHKALRSLVVDVIATNRSSFVQYIDGGDVQTHLLSMSEENTWATTCEIYAAATLLQRDIFMLTPDHNNTHYSWLLFKLSTATEHSDTNSHQRTASDKSNCSGSLLSIGKNGDDPCYLTLCNTNGNHYDRIVPDHGGCNCFLPEPQLCGQSGSVDLT